jgi:hypothetical protein
MFLGARVEKSVADFFDFGRKKFPNGDQRLWKTFSKKIVKHNILWCLTHIATIDSKIIVDISGRSAVQVTYTKTPNTKVVSKNLRPQRH